MSILKEACIRIFRKFDPHTPVYWKEGDVIYIDEGEVPWHKQAVLVFPADTHVIFLDPEEEFRTTENQELFVLDWSSDSDMTIGHLVERGRYFKVLNEPQEVRELIYITPTK